MKNPRIAIGLLTLSAAGLVGILTREDIKTEAYADPVHGWKVPTIGAGSIEGVKRGDKITPLAAVQRTLREVGRYEGALKGCVSVPLYQGEYDAYVELSHNIGTSAFCSSTIVKRLRAQDYSGACEAILMWRKAGPINDCSLPNDKCGGLWADRLRLHAKCTGAG